MRGKGKNRQSEFPHTGITPAYAGKSLFCRCSLLVIWDHPRLCGEKLKSIDGEDAGSGITPAYAGKSVS